MRRGLEDVSVFYLRVVRLLRQSSNRPGERKGNQHKASTKGTVYYEVRPDLCGKGTDPSRKGNLMEFLFWSMVGGLVGTVLMDIAGSLAEQLKITSRGS